jgi:hypothetical protein
LARKICIILVSDSALDRRQLPLQDEPHHCCTSSTAPHKLSLVRVDPDAIETVDMPDIHGEACFSDHSLNKILLCKIFVSKLNTTTSKDGHQRQCSKR